MAVEAVAIGLFFDAPLPHLLLKKVLLVASHWLLMHWIGRVQILLRFAYAHVQLTLYRPFIQFFNHQTSLAGEKKDDRHLVFATAGIKVCRNIINIGLELNKQAVLIGSYWFILHTQFLAVLCLVIYVSHNPDKAESSDILADATLGKNIISRLAQRSLAADRLSAALNVRIRAQGALCQYPDWTAFADRISRCLKSCPVM